MKIWTSYFAIINKLIKNGFDDFIAVSGTVPLFYKNLMNNNTSNRVFRRIVQLSPKKEWFFDWKAGKYTNEDYIRLYKETVLNNCNFESILNKLNNNSILLCYEKRGDFCHRHLIAEWLKQHDINCQEIENI